MSVESDGKGKVTQFECVSQENVMMRMGLERGRNGMGRAQIPRRTEEDMKESDEMMVESEGRKEMRVKVKER